MIKLYQIITIIALPLVRIYMLLRKAKGKEDTMRISERFGVASKARPEGLLIWFHAASAGESISVLPVISRLAEQFPNIHFLLTTGTVNSAKIMEKMLPIRTIHQYVPIDVLPYVNKFLKHWQPDLAIFAESEIWPNLVTQTSARCSLLTVNGHMSKRSFKKWQKYKSLSKEIFSSFSVCMTQSEQDVTYFKDLGVPNVKYMGNIKYGAAALPYDQEKLEQLLSLTSGRKIWLAASTHNENEMEEKIVAEVHKILKEEIPELLTIIVPRHPTRKNEVYTELSSMGIKLAVRSENEVITPDTDIYIADTMGELGLFYSLAPIVLVGGSLVPRGGHNPLEPARLNCAILIGKYAFNFTEINDEFLQNDAMIRVEDKEELILTIHKLFSDDKKISQMQNTALKLVSKKAGIIDEIVAEISPYIKKVI